MKKRVDDKSIEKQEPAAKKAKKNVASDEAAPKKLVTKKSLKSDDKKVIKGKFEKPLGAKKFGKASSALAKNNGKFTNKNNQENSGEKPDWKVFKKEKKELREKRKSKKLNEVYDVSVKAKQIGETLRQANCSPAEREKLCSQLFTLFNGNFNKLVFTHDMSRIVQWLLKYCNDKIRQSIVDEVKSSIVLMLQSKYAKNCIKKALRYGNDEVRQKILTACIGNVVKLMSHTIASPIIDKAYTSWANEKIKNYFKQEFYGDMYTQSKDDKITTLKDVFAEATDMKSATLSAVKINLLRVLNKNLVGSAVIQTVLAEYLALCSEEDRNELIVMLRDSIVELSKTKDGAKVAMFCIWHGTPKDRKLSLKAIKDNVQDLATSEHGHLILMAMFDSIDDTVLMKKILIPELLSDINGLISTEYGRKIILYLVARRDPRHFHPEFIALLQEGDGNAVSKKPAEIREKELLQAVIDCFLESITTVTSVWLESGTIAMVTLSILKAGQGEKLTDAFTAITEYLIDINSIIKEDEIKYSAVEHPGLHMMLKKLICADKKLVEKNECTFGEILIAKLDDSIIKRWIEFNRACFLLILLLENESESVKNNLISILKGSVKLLKCKKHPAASILLKKIK
ncbi:hypothetical protein PV325_012688 [Microctonus aethiopoides]|uniref:PUM-HD domain-containing protein n=1 Tax=Microctonus aethiopoides TaxID=144406 RepID=A0AA39FVY9_9HYME|nr:hypothetical protein PV325_012688 [Microctonus aethiopoides]KAK0096140.1 hypothetical protein PV326_006316 [Microctonus aethiopoides]KAK0176465.1 hypothetical protein PV328_000597 [Microctonus aethiopoides]